jgi:hypothetical protein
MSKLNEQFSTLREELLKSAADGARLAELTSRWKDLTSTERRPAALLNTGLIYVAVNAPYADMFQMPASRFTALEHYQIHRNTLSVLRMINAASLGEPFQYCLGQAEMAEAGHRYRQWGLTPLMNQERRALGLLLEYYTEDLDVR